MKRLLALSFSLVLCGAAAAAIAATTAAAQAPRHNPVQVAEANTAGRGRARVFDRPAPTAAERRTRRAEFCQLAYARAAGRFAYLEARLNLTSSQSTAFGRWRDLRLAAAKSRAAACANGPAPQARGARTAPSPVERLTREETRLQHRLADIQAERPALEALYNGLDAGQRRILAQNRGGMGRRGRMGPGGGMFRRGAPMRGAMAGRGGPGRMPPAEAPPQ